MIMRLGRNNDDGKVAFRSKLKASSCARRCCTGEDQKSGNSLSTVQEKKKENLKGVLAAHDGRATPWQSLPASSLLQRNFLRLTRME
jgi:hypothetical protein